jgi:siderophore synthetase component
MIIRSVSTGRLAAAAAHTQAALAVHAPALADGFVRNLPQAADIVGRRLRGALVREGLTPAVVGGREHAFNRVEYPTAGVSDPVDLLAGIDNGPFAAEIRNAVINLAVALSRFEPAERETNPDLDAVRLERLAVSGHNLHPCGRTRLGWDTGDVLAHDLEAGETAIRFIAVRDDHHLGDDLGEMLDVASGKSGFKAQPVHAWQFDVIKDRYRELFDDGVLRDLDTAARGVPTAALRTLYLPDHGVYLKVSLDIQVTSTRRSISIASTRNGPALSDLLHLMVADEPNLVLMAETGGAAVPAGSGRDMSAIVRSALALQPGEHAVPGGALPAHDPATGTTVLAGLVDASGLTPAAWLTAYTRLLLPPLLRLATRGVALEAHLQNCLPIFRDGRPHRLALRDFAGLRLHPARLAAAGHHLDLWPGSVIGTDDEDVLRAKLGYTALQAHLGELVIRLRETHDLPEDHAWRIVRTVIDETLDGHPDHAFYVAPTIPHKALVRMRLAGQGDIYLPVSNPLHG